MAKVTLGAVKTAHNDYVRDSLRWGENNQVTVRAMIRFGDLRRQWEAETGRNYNDTIMARFRK